MLSSETYNKFNSINWNRLLRNDLGSGSLKEAQVSLERIKKGCDRLVGLSLSNQLSKSLEQKLEAIIDDLFDFFRSEILLYSDISLSQSKIELIKEKEARLAAQMGDFIFYYSLGESEKKEDRENKTKEIIAEEVSILVRPLYHQLEVMQRYTTDLESMEKFKKTNESIQFILGNSEKLTRAVESAKEFLEKHEEMIAAVVSRNRSSVSSRAVEHATFYVKKITLPFLNYKIPVPKGSFLWLIGSFLSGSLVLWIVFYFVSMKEVDIKVGAAILRIATVLAPAYFTVFCSQQYLIHRKLYEAYQFRDVALNTMTDLRELLTGDSISQEKVLEKGLDVLFTEPSIEEKVKYDKQLLLETLRLIKN